jgi:hypothetical protein
MQLACIAEQPALHTETLELQPRENMQINWVSVGNARALMIDNVYLYRNLARTERP